MPDLTAISAECIACKAKGFTVSWVIEADCPQKGVQYIQVQCLSCQVISCLTQYPQVKEES